MKGKVIFSMMILSSSLFALSGCENHTHTFNMTKWVSNSEQHWHAATCGHVVVSDLGNHVDLNDDKKCDVCDRSLSSEHVHTFAQEWSSNKTQHWHAATCGHVVFDSVGNHVDSDGDSKCDTCGYVMKTPVHVHTFSDKWDSNSTEHWHVATCGHDVQGDLGSHIDNDGDYCCDVCSYKLPGPVHVHTFSDLWTNDSKEHWHAATCEHKDLTSDRASHYDNNKDNLCDVCNYNMGSRPDPGDYYSTITDDMSGNTLVSALNSIISKNVNVSYDWSRYEKADEDPNNTSNIITIYARTSLKKSAHVSGSTGWNREHSFPQSKMSGDCEKDNHIIFASDCKVNGTRSNYRLGELNISPNVEDSYGNKTVCKIGKKDGEQMFDPGDTIARGMVARATMYANVLYGLSVTSNFESYETLLKWHLTYEVDDFDLKRNETVYKLQKNRNPFVDHPEYACKIWGTKSAETKRLCGLN